MDPIHPYDLPEPKPLTGGSFDFRRFLSLLNKLGAVAFLLVIFLLAFLFVQHHRWTTRVERLKAQLVPGITLKEAESQLRARTLLEGLTIWRDGTDLCAITTGIDFSAHQVRLATEGGTISSVRWTRLALQLP
jgi:hypothetical protein